MSLSSFFVGEDSLVGGDDEVTELPGGEDAVGPLLEISESEVVAGRDDSALVYSADELDDDLLGSVVVDDLELADVAVDLHELEEANDELGTRPDDDLLLALAFSIDDGSEGVCQHVHFHHSSINQLIKLYKCE